MSGAVACSSSSAVDPSGSPAVSSGSAGSSGSSCGAVDPDGGGPVSVAPGTVDLAFGDSGRLALAFDVVDTALDGDGVAFITGSRAFALLARSSQPN